MVQFVSWQAEQSVEVLKINMAGMHFKFMLKINVVMDILHWIPGKKVKEANILSNVHVFFFPLDPTIHP